jgi:class 3 adenylate cyclase/Flp pilus assembly protein TadD
MASAHTRYLAAIWFADIVGFTALASRNEDAALELADDLRSVASRVAEANGGRIVKHIGDAVLVSHSSISTALTAAVALMEEFPSLTGSPATLRIGVHLGEVSEIASGDLLGDGVNTAARLQGIAKPGQVVISEAVFQQIRTRPVFAVESLGEVQLKGLDAPVLAFCLQRPDRDGDSPNSANCPAHPRGAATPLWEFIEHQGALFQDNRFEEMLACVRAARSIHGDTADLWNHQGVALSDMGRLREALDAFERAIELNPSGVEPWCNKGRALRQLDRSEEAVHYYDQAIDRNPAEVIPWVNKGNCLLEDLGRLDEAADCFNKVLSLQPSSPGDRASFARAREQLVLISRMRSS